MPSRPAGYHVVGIAPTGRAVREPARLCWSAATDFAAWVTPGRAYVVLGVGVFDSVLLALISGDDERPAWLPIALFDLPTSPLPDRWELAVRDGLAASGQRNPPVGK